MAAESDLNSGGQQAGWQVPAWIVRVSVVSWAFVGAVVATGLTVVAMGAVREIIIPLVLSGFLAVVFSPGVGWLARHRVLRALGAILVLLFIAAIVALSIGALVVGIIDQADNLERRFDDVVVEIEDVLDSSQLGDFADTVLSGAEDSGGFLRDGLGSTVGTILGTASGFASGLVVGSVMLYYLLKDGPKLVHDSTRRRDGSSSPQVERILGDAAASIRAYVKGRTLLAVIQGAIIGIVAAIAGVPLAFAIGIVNLFGAYIPYIGGFVGGSFAVLMALSEGGLPLALLVLVVVLAVSVGLENLLEPALLGDELELHPIVILFATVTGGLLVGIVGMFLAAPGVAIGWSLIREFSESGFFRTDHNQRPTVNDGEQQE